MTKSFEYPCVIVRQSSGGKSIILFSASAAEIDNWVGIPQRLSLSGTETAGFQRTVSPAREAALRKFFADERNVIQNPLLCAIRQAPGIQVTFEPLATDTGLGTIRIELDHFEGMNLEQLLRSARTYLESRVPALAQRPSPASLIIELEDELIARSGSVTSDGTDTESGFEAEEPSSDGPAEDALFDESQITDFWDHLRAREEVAKKLGTATPADLVGFSRELLISYLRPVILVDGQHRLRGAILAVEDEANYSDRAEDLVADGTPAAAALATVAQERARHLPVSLLMDDSPAEHVFQYVLVNQKATPVPKALLGTIISTSLAEDELSTVADRLEDAKIPLEGARIISILSRAEDSPFAGLVAKGFGADDGNKLPWSVLGSLSDIFRYLKGARFYHNTDNDHSAIWRSHHLSSSAIVADWQAKDFDTPMDYWQDLNGPWMLLFKAFWARVRERLGSDDPSGHNFWGDTRKSNLFNKPTLHILTADFFSFLREQKAKIESAEQVAGLVDDWLEYVSDQYFTRDWKLDGVKKDSVGTRRQWSKLWADHRQKGGTPPKLDDYSKLLRS